MFQELKNIYHLKQAVAASFIHGFPGRKLTVIGVTGTDGKTTTATLLNHILREAGKKTVLVTTLGARIGDQEFETGLHVTTPSSFTIQKLLARAVREGCTHAVLECSSHALDQNRVWGIPFALGVLTNISHEHLDYHKTMQRYTAAKLKLLRIAPVVIINKDDGSFPSVSEKLKDKKVITYALSDNNADLTAEKFPFETKLFGAFNRSNCLAAAAAARELGIDDGAIQKSIATFKNPQGRQDIVYDRDFKVMIDFAVTPRAFETMLPEIRKQTHGRLIHVFGLSGKRDRAKRPIMGTSASKFDDIIVLTADDPRDEPVESINREILSGVTGFAKADASQTPTSVEGKKVFEIPDRQEAINYAIALAKPGDFVLLTGKAHEKSLAMPGGELPWDEYKAVRTALAKRSL